MRTLNTICQLSLYQDVISLQKTFCLTLILLFTSYISFAHAKDRVIDVDIQSQQTDKALLQLAESTGIQIMFAEGIGKNTQSAAVMKGMSLDEALTKILENTGLSFEYSSDDLVVVEETNRKMRSQQSTWKNGVKVAATELAQLQDQEGKTERRGSSTTANNAGGILEEVIVTAQFREQSIQDIPVSISAFTGQFMENAGLSSAHDLAKFTPGFTASQFSAAEPIFTIRGANNTFTSASANKPVGFFLDDIYISRNSGAAFDLFDLEQVTVLRGPQGTLAGRNVTGGAVKVTTSKPSLKEFEAKLEAGYGNYDAMQFRGLVNGPISENVAGKLSFSYKNRDGFGSDPALNNRDTDDLDSLNFRGQLLFVPNDDLEILATLSYSKDENNNRNVTNLEPGIDDGDIRTTEVGVPQFFDRDIFSASVHIDWDLEPGTVKSITAYRESDSTDFFARVGANISQLSTFAFTGGLAFDDISTDVEEPKTFSQELRFVSEEHEHFNYVVGLYYFNDEVDRNLGRTRDIPAGSFATFLLQDNNFVQSVETESVAVYADVQVHLGETLDLNFGGRYTYEKKEASEAFTNNLNAAASFTASDERSWNRFTPRVALSWRPMEDISFFASYTEGFTSGGFFTEATTLTGFNTTYDEEVVKNIEVGLKAQWLERRLTTNITAFTSDYKDKQEIFFTGATIMPLFTVVTANAGEATIKGVEVELAWLATENLSFSASYAHLDAKYDEFIAGTSGDFSGNRLGTSPRHSASIYADYTYDMGDKGRLLLNGSYAWTDSFFNGASNNNIESVRAYGLLNGNLSYETADAHWRVTLWTQNLTDTEYRLFGSNFITPAAYFGPPRTYGLRVSYQF